MVLWIGFDLQAEIDTGGDYNWTALQYAALKGKEAVAAQLLQAGASVSAVAANGSTPLHLAAVNGKSSIVNLLKINVIPTAVDKFGYSPAQYEKRRGYIDLEARLLEAEQAAALK